MTQMIDIAKVKAVPTTLKDNNYRTTKLSEFRAAAPSVLFGKRLKEVEQLEISIRRHGLMRPLQITSAANKLVVIDGHKRLAALRRMRFKNTLPRSLVNIPFVLSTEPVPHMLSAQEQYRNMISLSETGAAEEDIILALCLNFERLHALQSIERLSPRLKSAFLNAAISLEQAYAFAALPWHEAQDSLLLSLGPSAPQSDILNAISTRCGRPKASLNLSEKRRDIENLIVRPSPPLINVETIDFSALKQVAA